MEYFEASTRMNKDVCLKKLKESDLIIGIYGRRYGSIDPETGLSFTEIEFNAAREWKKPFLGFVLMVGSGERENREIEFVHKVFSTGILCAKVDKKKDFATKLNDSLKKYFAGLDGYDYAGIWNEINETQQLMESVFGEKLSRDGNDVDYALDKLDVMGEDFERAVDSGDRDSIAVIKRKYEVIVSYLRLNRLKDRLLHEPWSQDLRREVLLAREGYMKTIDEFFKEGVKWE